MSRFAAVGDTTNDLLTYKGRVILHHCREEMEVAFWPRRIVRVTDGSLGRPWMWMKDHPQLEHAKGRQLQRSDFIK